MPEDPGHRYELVDGELVDLGGTMVHGIVTGQVGSLLLGHVEDADLTLVCQCCGWFQSQ